MIRALKRRDLGRSVARSSGRYVGIAAGADRVLQRVNHLRDRHQAAGLRAALEGCLMKLSI
jgi:hypothetical protein